MTTSETTTPTSTQTTTPGHGKLYCVDFNSGSTYLAVRTAANCSLQVDYLNAIIGTCSETDGNVFCNNDLVGGHRLVKVTDNCAASAAGLNAAVVAHSRSELEGGLNCSIAGFISGSSDCADVADTLNGAISGYIGGSFRECQITTPTSTGTSSATTTATRTLTTTGTSSQTTSQTSTNSVTQTSTVTSSATTTDSVTETTTQTTSRTTTQTTTPSHGQLGCLEFGNSYYVAMSATTNCAPQASQLNTMIGACTDTDGSMTCWEDLPNGATLRPLQTSTSAQCEHARDTMIAMVAEHSRGTATANISCSIENVLQELGSSCDTTMATLNSAFDSCLDGTFADCEMTTPTTSQTTSATTTITSTVTSTITSTVTSTITSTVTSTVTTTPQYGQLECATNRGVSYVVHGGTDTACDAQVTLLNELVSTCTGGEAAIACSSVEVNEKSLLHSSEGCGNTAAIEGLSNIVGQYTRNGVNSSLVCSVGGYFRAASADACLGTVGYLNAALSDYFEGSFLNW